MERFYYKDSKGNLFNFKTPGFIKYKEIEEKFYWNDENGNPVLDENGEQRYDIEKKIVADGLLDGYTQITKEEFEELTKPKVYGPTAEEKAAQEKKKLIAEKKALLNKYREDVEQVDLFGMERADYEEKKLACKTLVEELRVLEKNV